MVKLILLDYEYHALQVAGFNNDITTFSYNTAVERTSYHIRKKTFRGSSFCEFLHGSELLLGSIRRFCITVEGPVAIVDTFKRMTKSILRIYLTFSKSEMLSNSATIWLKLISCLFQTQFWQCQLIV